MNVPRFEEALLAKPATAEKGDLFQQFVQDLLSLEYPGLHPFPGAGKDGGIDLVQKTEASRLVVECKYVGSDGLQPAQTRWNEVADKFRRNLTDPAGPPTTEPQYGPWYKTDPAIGSYLFCVSSIVKNLNQFDKLETKIADFFKELSAKHAHLKHLADVAVTVLDWNDLATRFQQHPHLLFRWFPRSRPLGLTPLDEQPESGTFRAYLSSDKLTYYSREQFLAETGNAATLPSEAELLQLLDRGDLTGLILTGSGGVGKTRLTLELGRTALRQGWLVLRVGKKLRENALEQLAEQITPQTRVLLLLDYIETQQDFSDVAGKLEDLNATYSLR
ncbi:MAG: ATP-binding protein, partial [Acidobacteriota bacterium]|nr:ATP-binding protein [Acidobacteriota bacterium]